MSQSPNFFLLGAPKCGTTSLAFYLSQHPEIFFSTPKEPCFFNDDMLVRNVVTLEAYEALFQEVVDESAVGEGSVFYLYSSDAVPNILDYSPDAQFIVCLRNPVSMVESWYAQLVYEGYETAESVEAAWHLQTARSRGKEIPGNCRDPQFLQYGEICSTGSQVLRLLSHADRDSVLLLLLDDLAQRPLETTQRVFRHLGVTPDFEPNLVVRNKRKAVRSRTAASLLQLASRTRRRLGLKHTGLLAPLHRVNERPWDRPRPSSSFLRELRDFFRPEVRIISDVIDQDLKHWS